MQPHDRFLTVHAFDVPLQPVKPAAAKPATAKKVEESSDEEDEADSDEEEVEAPKVGARLSFVYGL